MAFDNLPPSKAVPRRAKKDPIFCVGWKAFVHWPPQGVQTTGPVPLVDGAGNLLANDLSDAEEVEIVSWRPRSREGLVYQIRRLADGSEWWIGAKYLRRERLAAGGGDPTTGVEQR